MTRLDLVLFRSLPPSGAKNVTWTEWEQQMQRPELRAAMAGITSRMLTVYDMLPAKDPGNLAEVIRELQNDPIFDEIHDLFWELPVALRPMGMGQTNIVLIAFRFAGISLLST